jgi:hypothetical protein
MFQKRFRLGEADAGTSDNRERLPISLPVSGLSHINERGDPARGKGGWAATSKQ